MPKKPLSHKPSATRARMRRSGTKLERDVEILYKPVDEWDMEELARGRPRNRNGTFGGPKPKWLSPLITREARDRLRILTRQELSIFAGDAIRVMTDLMKSEDTDYDGKPLVSANVRLQAATYVLDQIIGKPTTPVEMSGNVTLQALMADVLVNDDEGTRSHPIIDGEVADDDEPDEEEDDE